MKEGVFSVGYVGVRQVMKVVNQGIHDNLGCLYRYTHRGHTDSRKPRTRQIALRKKQSTKTNALFAPRTHSSVLIHEVNKHGGARAFGL